MTTARKRFNQSIWLDFISVIFFWMVGQAILASASLSIKPSIDWTLLYLYIFANKKIIELDLNSNNSPLSGILPLKYTSFNLSLISRKISRRKVITTCSWQHILLAPIDQIFEQTIIAPIQTINIKDII